MALSNSTPPVTNSSSHLCFAICENVYITPLLLSFLLVPSSSEHHLFIFVVRVRKRMWKYALSLSRRRRDSVCSLYYRVCNTYIAQWEIFYYYFCPTQITLPRKYIVLTKTVNESISFWLDLMDSRWFSFRLLLFFIWFVLLFLVNIFFWIIR